MIECMVNGICLRLDIESSLFSPSHIDQGTRTMLSNVQFPALILFYPIPLIMRIFMCRKNLLRVGLRI